MKTTTRKSYRIEHGSRFNFHKDSYQTLKEARKEIKEMRAGFPNKKHMSKENHTYWAEVGAEAKIVEVVTIEVTRPMQVI